MTRMGAGTARATAAQIDALSAGRRAGAHISIRDGLAGAAGETAALIGG